MNINQLRQLCLGQSLFLPIVNYIQSELLIQSLVFVFQFCRPLCTIFYTENGKNRTDPKYASAIDRMQFMFYNLIIVQSIREEVSV